jgi:GNAT superfamily N-acetyltransferase
VGAGVVRPGSGRPDDFDRTLVTQDVQFRRVHPAEAEAIAPALAALHAEAMRAGMALGAAPTDDASSLTDSYREVVARLDDRERLIFAAEQGGRLIAMGHLVFSGVRNAPHRAEVQRVAVAETARGTGVGRRLMTLIEDSAGELGVSLLWLTTHAGAEACAFYEAVGYTELGVMPSYSLRPDGALSPAAFYFRELST